MSILIRGMEMPKPGQIVLVEMNENGDVFAAYDGGRTKLSQYKAVPVPDHGDLIDRDKLEKDIDKYIGGEESRSRFHHWVQVQDAVIPMDKGAET